MRKTPAKKAAIVVVIAMALIALSAAIALGAPVLQPGTTSAPGMSGVCTDCHVYATTPVVTPPVVTPPSTTPPSAGESHDSDEAPRPVAKASHHKKHHHRKAVRHHESD